MRNLRCEQELIQDWKGDLSKPLVSICCITYNHELYIEDALEGFLIQETDFPIEILIHDDASIDKTRDIIREYEAEYPNLIKPLYQAENQYSKGNKPSLINMQRAKGRFIAFCEGDDYWTDPAKLSTQINFMATYRNCVMCFHRSNIWHYIDGKVSITTSKCFSDIDIWPRSILFFEGGSTAPSATMLYRKSALSELPAWYHLSPVGDMAMKLLFFLQGDIGYIDRVMAVRRIGTPGSWNVRTRLNPMKQNEYLVRMIAMLKSFDKSTNHKWKNDIYEKIISYELQKNTIGLSQKVNIRKEYYDYFKNLSFLGKIKLFIRERTINARKLLSKFIS